MLTLNLLTVCCFLLYLAAIFLFHKKKTGWAIFTLALAAFVLRLEMASLDPFIHNWDERFHALVSKNMMQEPFRPMLYTNPAIPFDYKAWCCNHIWVHKQPLYLWQIALSLKIFGINELAVRLPSVIMGAISVFFVYRLANQLTKNKDVSFLSAFLFSLSYYNLELTSGMLSLEHNDVAFGFYILASLWAFGEYLQKRTWKWVLIIGIFSGAAILCKWLTGLLVYAGWGVAILSQRTERENIRSYVHLGVSALIAIATMLPWQVYIMYAYPQESAWEYAYNTRHLFEVLEGHGHEWWYYFTWTRIHYGKFFLPFLAGGLLLMFYQRGHRSLRIALVTCFAVVYLFFSIAATKLLSFTFIAAPIGFIAIAIGMVWVRDRIIAKLPAFRYLQIPLIILFGIYCAKPWMVREARGTANQERLNEIHNVQVYKSLPDSIVGSKTIVINNLEHRNIELMFYKNVTAYPGVLDEGLLDSLHRTGYRIYSFPAYENDSLPAFIRERSFIQVLPQQLR